MWFHYHGYGGELLSIHHSREAISHCYRGGDWCVGRYHVLLVVWGEGRVLFPSTIAPFALIAPPVCATHMGPITSTDTFRIELVYGDRIPPKGGFLLYLSRIHRALLVLETFLLVLGRWCVYHHLLLYLLTLPPFRHHLLPKVRVGLRTLNKHLLRDNLSFLLL